jgi:L-alanine-DL-glutamate epimerase-like enolase superfamily enzyme
VRIVEIIEVSVPLAGDIANAVVSFAGHDVSLVAVVSDAVRQGKPVVGFGFNSIGRFAQGGILRDRIIPRLRAAAPEDLLDETGYGFDPARVASVAMRNEKPGGHGDRAGAVAAVELAIWDLNAKLADEPAYVTIARGFGRPIESREVAVYAAGGYYYPPGSGQSLTDEFRAYRDLGFDAFKMKIGGAPLERDLARIEEALQVAGSGSRLSVDANGRFDIKSALAYAEKIRPYGLRWYEEIGDPLDYGLNRQVTEAYDGPVATGENLFSAADAKNLVLFGGMRSGRDIFQMDPGLSYGLTEYGRMLVLLEQHGFDPAQAFPHGGHLINLHIAVGLGLGGCEAYPGVFQPFGGFPDGCSLGGGTVQPTDAPGFGLEEKVELARVIRTLDLGRATMIVGLKPT